MNLTDPTAIKRALVFAALTLAGYVNAQEAVMSDPATTLPPLLLRKASSTLSAPPANEGAFFSFGPFSLHPRVTSRAVYALGLPTPGGRRVASMIYTQAPGLRLDLGQSWTLDYSPTWVSYTARALSNKLDHSASLQGAWVMQNWAVQFSESYSIAAPILLATGQQTPQRNWGTQLGATRNLTSKLSLQNMTSLDERYGDTFPSSRDWATMNWFIFQFSTRLQGGLGLGAGYSDVARQPDDTSLRYMGRLNWRPTDKLSLSLDGGLEERKSRAAAAKKLQNPILTASLGYQPFDVTQLMFSSTRTVTTSYFQNQITEGKEWEVGLQQRLLGRFYFRFSYGRNQSHFTALTNLPATSNPAAPTLDGAPISLPGRSDNNESFNASLSTKLFDQLMLRATYQRTTNSSNQSGFGVASTQYGFELSYSF